MKPNIYDYISYNSFKPYKHKLYNKDKAIEEAQKLSFLLTPKSLESKALIERLVELLKPELGKKGKLSPLYTNALELTVPMLLKAIGEDEGGYVYRSTATSRFTAGLPGNETATGITVGHEPFKRVVDDLAREGFLEVITGHKECVAAVGVATRFKATPKLIDLAIAHNVLPESWHLHFSPAPRPVQVPNPIMLKASSTKRWKTGDGRKEGKMAKEQGVSLPVDYSLPHVAAYAEGVNRLSRFMARQDIQPAHLYHSFYRVFSEGDNDGADYSKGGRIYVHGVGNGYQNVRKHVRRRMTINGEAIAEVDLRASYLTILHQRLGYPLPAADPYTMPEVPRHIVKIWVSANLGNGRLLTKWPDELVRKYKEDSEGGSGDLKAEYPIKQTGQTIMKHLPIMKAWSENPTGWGDLQFTESTVVMAAINKLAFVHGVPALPLHDALMVAESQAELAARCLWESFHEHVGIYPYISINTHKQAEMRLAA